MNTKHTPGPWGMGQTGESSDFEINAGNKQVAVVRDGRHVLDMKSNEESTANARLIAAAPELLAALNRMMRVTPMANDQQIEAIQQAMTALAKVEGKAVRS